MWFLLKKCLKNSKISKIIAGNSKILSILSKSFNSIFVYLLEYGVFFAVFFAYFKHFKHFFKHQLKGGGIFYFIEINFKKKNI